MRGMWSMVAVVAMVVVLATYLTWTAGRVDRLHHRAAAAQAALDTHLIRRAVAASALAEAVQLPSLELAARSALDAAPEDREAAENDLTHQLRVVISASQGDVFGEVVDANRRVALARQLHNDVVRDALAVRRGVTVRGLRLARRYAKPAYFDIDDPTVELAVVRL
ncbi:MAG TPA: hypothetical protein VK453_22725 [Micromonosporaceae bacterium]|nr:hypothetical protein [Micromonosporaceae bacterium]